MLTSTLARKRPSGRPRRRWEDNIRLDLKERGIGLIWLRIRVIEERLSMWH